MTTTATVTPGGLFSIEASLRIQPGSDLEISCRILNRRLNASRESRIRIHDVFLPSISQWLRIFLAVLFLNMALISIVFCQIRGSNKRTMDAGKAKLEMEEEKKKVKSVLDGEKAKKRAAKIQFKKRFGQMKAELDFWEARSHAVPVALDPEARPLDLGDAQDPLRVPVLVARDALGAGKRYWEVELPRERDWALGVLRKGPSLPGPHSRDSRDSRHCWALRASQGQLFSSGSGSRLLREQSRGLSVLGVFLDSEEERLEFYDVEQRDLVARMSLGAGEDPSGKFFPFVSQGEEGTLRIRPVPMPVPL
ncbi:butyrophilin subfamily 2 member A1-like [Cyanocitta cristata]